MSLIDLFCGTGGFSLGAHRAGLSVDVAVDVDPILTSSFRSNFPDTKLKLADLSKVTGAQLRSLASGPVVGVFGGPPCQGFSNIGLRSEDDPRRLLLGHFFRLVKELRPTFFVMENVVGISQGNSKTLLEKALAAVPRRFKVLGPILLDAADFGAATKRPRIFVIGFDTAKCDAISSEDIQKYKKPPATVEDAISDLSSATFVGDDETGFDVWQLQRSKALSAYARSLRSIGQTITGHRLTKHTQGVIERFDDVPQGGVDKVGRHPRLAWAGQCPTLRAGTGSDKGSFQSVRPLHPDIPRVITVREAARLQGFEDAHRFHPTVWHSFRMIGNSVSPFVAEAIFRAIADRTEVVRLEPKALAAAE